MRVEYRGFLVRKSSFFVNGATFCFVDKRMCSLFYLCKSDFPLSTVA